MICPSPERAGIWINDSWISASWFTIALIKIRSDSAYTPQWRGRAREPINLLQEMKEEIRRSFFWHLLPWIPATSELVTGTSHLKKLQQTRGCKETHAAIWIHEWTLPGREESCAAVVGCCYSTGCASGGRPRSRNHPKSVVAAAPGCAAQPPAPPMAGYLPAARSVPQTWGLY